MDVIHKIIALDKAELERQKAEIFQRYHPNGYATKVESEHYFEKDGRTDLEPVLYFIQVIESRCQWEFLTDDLDEMREKIKQRMFFCIAENTMNIVWREFRSKYYMCTISRYASCD
jgi:hypothetical protein